MKNNHCLNSALKRAVEALQRAEVKEDTTLPVKTSQIARKGLPTEFFWKHWNIRYLTKDRQGVFCLHWIVSNGISGTQRTFYTRDYVGKSGNVNWRKLSSDMKKV